jgi:hypothetical protein
LDGGFFGFKMRRMTSIGQNLELYRDLNTVIQNMKLFDGAVWII